MRKIGNVLAYAFLCLIFLVTVYPFVMMVLGSFKSNFEIMTLHPDFWPRNGFRFNQYAQVFHDWPFLRNLFNSFAVAVCAVVSAVFFCTIAGFTFAKHRFAGKPVLLLATLFTIMFPLETRLVPTYKLISDLGWLNTYWGLIVPGAVPAFGVFLIRQFAVSSISDELLEAARMEGASETGILFKIAFPLLLPGISTLALLTFMGSWNDFLYPLIILSDKQMFTASVALRAISDTSLMADYGEILAAATMATIPILAVYVVLHKKMITGVIEGAGKGI